MKNVCYHTYTKLYNSGVTPILEYSCAVWPCAKANEIDVIQNRAMRYFLHKYAPNAGLSGDMGWIKHAYNSPIRELAARGTSTNQIAASWMLQAMWLATVASRHLVWQTLLISP